MTPVARLALSATLLSSSTLIANEADPANYLTGANVSLAKILYPHLHFNGVYGLMDKAPEAHYETSAHDPSNEGWTLQGFEFGTSLRLPSYLEGFVNYHLYQNPDNREWDGDFEEAFLKFQDLPAGLSLRSGQYFNRFGLQNSQHQHSWNYIDQNLINTRYLGEHALTTRGVELTWLVPLPGQALLSLSFGDAYSTEHSHHHAGADHDQTHTANHIENPLALDGNLWVVNYTHQLDYNDFHQFRFGASGAWGDNYLHKSTQIYGLHFQYEWRENGYESGGKFVRWRNEAMYRDSTFNHEFPHHHDHDDHHHHDDSPLASIEKSLHDGGFATSVLLGLTQQLELGLRGEYLKGHAASELDERFRISPNLTYYLNSDRNIYVRLQYNYDHSSTHPEQHGMWLQVGMNWGSNEVR